MTDRRVRPEQIRETRNRSSLLVGAWSRPPGSYAAGAHGFHVIAPTDRRPWTHDIYRSSRRLALVTRAALQGVGLSVATYIAGGDGLDFRSDLATLNLSDVPTVMVELGNMRSAVDARRMTQPRGRATYARGLAHAVRDYLSD